MTISRRSVLGGLAGGTTLAGLGAVTAPSASATPAMAGQYGFTKLVLQDDFTSLSTIDLGQTGAPGFTWYGRAPWDMPSVRPADVQILSEGGTSFLRLTPSSSRCNWQLGTIDPRTGNGHSFVQGYAEIRMRFHTPPEPNWATVGRSFAWPSFWGITRGNAMSNGERNSVEIDVVEACAGPGGYVGVLHDSRNGQVWSSQNSHLTTGADSAQWHTYGFGWTTGGAAWFFDDRLVTTQTWGTSAQPAAVLTGSNTGGAPADVFTPLDTADMVFGFGSGIGVPMDVDFVRIWGR